MADLKRKVSRLHDLIDRYDGREGRQGRILHEMADILEDVAEGVEELAEGQEELEDYLGEIDSDLLTLEEDVLPASGTGHDEAAADREEIELQCPECGHWTAYNAALFDSGRDGVELTCPNCGAVVYDSDVDCLVMDDEEEAQR
ncbi:conserved protein of unknown function [Candidatus Hydrogenisulfobacillus filiaventi]|uniref:DUF8106 domain-containing protein n=1 Tax=Candidatus Hydrogenisulfobacillus filiaventi TaxID=2707344 RepID=A0A6F8ZGT5_9FIRM|nr:hypothetical protein [Bacillota bacterium]CAB1128917.1 conserved protein of unknown function [Candidatus Hydrogenisulfobacillus filiaventi]